MRELYKRSLIYMGAAVVLASLLISSSGCYNRGLMDPEQFGARNVKINRSIDLDEIVEARDMQEFAEEMPNPSE